MILPQDCEHEGSRGAEGLRGPANPAERGGAYCVECGAKRPCPHPRREQRRHGDETGKEVIMCNWCEQTMGLHVVP